MSGQNIPASLVRIDLDVTVAGRDFLQTFPATTNLSAPFTWDGLDAYGRQLQGAHIATIKIGYVYNGVYGRTPHFAYPSGGATFGLGVSAGRSQVTFTKTYSTSVGAWDARAQAGLGGWTLSDHNAYDPVARILYLGDGSRRSANDVSPLTISTPVGHFPGFGGDGGPATQAQLNNPTGIAFSPDGSEYIADSDNEVVRRVGVDGVITTVAGIAGTGGFSGDGGPVTQAQLSGPSSVAVAPDGSLYIGDMFNHRVRRVGSDGVITTVAGSGSQGLSGDGGPASQAQLTYPSGLPSPLMGRSTSPMTATKPSGGWGSMASSPLWLERAPPALAVMASAPQAQLNFPIGLAVAPDGSLYIADHFNGRIRRVGLDGVISSVAGGSEASKFNGDGGPAAQAVLYGPMGVAVTPLGTLYITSGDSVRKVGVDGIITTVAGGDLTGGSGGDGGPATAGRLLGPQGVAVAPDGSLYIADSGNDTVRRVASALPGFSAGDIAIASADGAQLYQFDANGRHLRTLDALTGAVLFSFGYDSAGRLAQITDVGGNVTRIERDASGTPTAIVAPGGQRTALTVDGNGYLSSVTDPAGDATKLTSDADGLLTTLTDPRGNVHSFSYDALGRLTKDADPAGGSTTLARTETADGATVTQTSAQGRVTTYEFHQLPTGGAERVVTSPTGARADEVIGTDGTSTLTQPDGTVIKSVQGPDPRFGMQAPILTSMVQSTPGGVTSTTTGSRQVALADPNDPLSLTSLTDTRTVDGHSWTRAYDAAKHTLTQTTPAGQLTVFTLDQQGRVVQSDPGAGVAPVTYGYDGAGRLIHVAQGDQSADYAYDDRNRLVSSTDAAGGRVSYAYDDADRPTQVTSAAGRIYQYAYDANGNATQIIAPSGAVNGFTYTPLDFPSTYTPPAMVGSASPVASTYSTDRQRTGVTLPSGRSEAFSFDSAGRPTGSTSPEVSTVVSYADSTDRVQSLSRAPTGGSTEDLTYAYDGPLLTGQTSTGPSQGAVAYSYQGGFVTGITITGGPTIAVSHNADGNLTGYGNFSFQRDGPFAQATKVSDGTMTQTLAYDSLGRRSGLTMTIGGTTVYSDHQAYDNVGRTIQRIETAAGSSSQHDYSYDTDGQLTKVASGGSATETYTYDANLNRTSRQLGTAQPELATYDARDGLIQRGTIGYALDADGSVTQRGADHYSYATDGTLLSATVSGQTITYGYDGLRRLVSRTDAGGTSQYLYANPGNALQVTASRNEQGALTTYTYDPAGHLVALDRGGTRYYVATDPTGSPRVITDASGTPVRLLTFDSFGNIENDTNPGFDLPVGFAGGIADPATGLVRFGLREYDPAAGRFMSRDPTLFGGQSINLYAYAANDPIGQSDPTGLISFGASVYDGIGAGVKVAFTSKGFSLCGEAGFGAGVELTTELDAGLDADSVGLFAQAKADLFGVASVKAKGNC